MRQKNPNKKNPKRLTVTYEDGELNSANIQHAAYDAGFSSMSKLGIFLFQTFMKNPVEFLRLHGN